MAASSRARVLPTASPSRHSNASHRVVVLDHIPKDNKTGRYARDSGAKLATVDVAITVDPIRAFSRQQSGLVNLTVTKDRRGCLHRAHKVRVDVEDGVMALTFERVAVEQDDPNLAGLSPAALKVLEVLRASEEQLTIAAITRGRKGTIGSRAPADEGVGSTQRPVGATPGRWRRAAGKGKVLVGAVISAQNGCRDTRRDTGVVGVGRPPGPDTTGTPAPPFVRYPGAC
jgi:hypothetical protein